MGESVSQRKRADIGGETRREEQQNGVAEVARSRLCVSSSILATERLVISVAAVTLRS